MKLLQPKSQTRFCRYNGRPALFHATQDHSDYWKNYWDAGSRRRLTLAGQNGDLGEFEEIFLRHLPRNLPVLEAGCGPAHLVAALATRGFDAIGVDYEPEVIRFVNENLPDLKVYEGNVLSLDFETGSVGGYVSIGVVEHFVDGPGAAIVEARRVLHPDGVALISVPYANPLRQRYFRSLTDGDIPSGLSFHQYYFEKDEFESILQQNGFRVVEDFPYAIEAFAIREHPSFSRFWRSPVCREVVKRPLRNLFSDASYWMRNRYAHMIMFACKPK